MNWGGIDKFFMRKKAWRIAKNKGEDFVIDNYFKLI